MSTTQPIDRRAHPRFPVRAPVEYHSPSVGGRGTTLNLSLSGACIAAAPVVTPREPVELRFSFFADSPEIAYPARVVRLTLDGFAIRFDELSDEQLRILRRVLTHAALSEARSPSATDGEHREHAERAIVGWLEGALPNCEIEVLPERLLTTFCLLWDQRRQGSSGSAVFEVAKYVLEDEGPGIVESLRSGRVDEDADLSIRDCLARRESVRVERDERGVLVAVRIPGRR